MKHTLSDVTGKRSWSSSGWKANMPIRMNISFFDVGTVVRTFFVVNTIYAVIRLYGIAIKRQVV